MERLTPAEEQVMQALWDRGKAFVKDLLEDMPAPKPAYTTVSTIVRILEQKGFVDHEAFGRSHRYYPTLTRDQYRERSTKRLVTDYFSGSPRELLSFFLDRKEVDVQELDELLRMLRAKRQS
ncbi:MAG: BlaI/MecI/CopY family transcriptional regulator [Flavobacteriales bacterium]|nr:BlaI/MecI/CopY family transcriptional regulator [Flavobacteriales bacterium]MCB9168496.1 BlaI/MecI/CopY family transcriptional regulator [Flavobacteriales bacterium]